MPKQPQSKRSKRTSHGVAPIAAAVVIGVALIWGAIILVTDDDKQPAPPRANPAQAADPLQAPPPKARRERRADPLPPTNELPPPIAKPTPTVEKPEPVVTPPENLPPKAEKPKKEWALPRSKEEYLKRLRDGKDIVIGGRFDPNDPRWRPPKNPPSDLPNIERSQYFGFDFVSGYVFGSVNNKLPTFPRAYGKMVAVQVAWMPNPDDKKGGPDTSLPVIAPLDVTFTDYDTGDSWVVTTRDTVIGRGSAIAILPVEVGAIVTASVTYESRSYSAWTWSFSNSVDLRVVERLSVEEREFSMGAQLLPIHLPHPKANNDVTEVFAEDLDAQPLPGAAICETTRSNEYLFPGSRILTYTDERGRARIPESLISPVGSAAGHPGPRQLCLYRPGHWPVLFELDKQGRVVIDGDTMRGNRLRSAGTEVQATIERPKFFTAHIGRPWNALPSQRVDSILAEPLNDRQRRALLDSTLVLSDRNDEWLPNALGKISTYPPFLSVRHWPSLSLMTEPDFTWTALPGQDETERSERVALELDRTPFRTYPTSYTSLLSDGFGSDDLMRCRLPGYGTYAIQLWPAKFPTGNIQGAAGGRGTKDAGLCGVLVFTVSPPPATGDLKHRKDVASTKLISASAAAQPLATSDAAEPNADEPADPKLPPKSRSLLFWMVMGYKPEPVKGSPPAKPHLMPDGTTR